MSTKHTPLEADGIKILDPSKPGFRTPHRWVAEAKCSVMGLADVPKVNEAKAFAAEMVNVWNTHDGLVAERDRLREAVASVETALCEVLNDFQKHNESIGNYSDGEYTQDYTTRSERVSKALAIARAALNREEKR